MSLDYWHGFDELATGDFALDGWGGSVPASMQTGRFSGQCFRTGSTAGCTRPFLVSSTRQTVGVAWRGPTSLNATGQIIRYFDGATEQGRLTINADGSLSVSRAGTALTGGTSAAGVLTIGTWYYIEFDYTCNDTTGAFEVRVNGVSVCSGSGQDTRNGGTGNLTILYLASANGQNSDFDDLYMASGSTSFQGDCRVMTNWPTGAGATTQWTPLSGNNWQNVDETTPDGDTTYNSDATSGHIDTFTTGALGVTGTVLGVMVHAFARKDDAGARNFCPELRDDGGTNRAGTTVALGASYTGYSDNWLTNPNGGGAWTVTAVDNSEFGYKDV